MRSLLAATLLVVCVLGFAAASSLDMDLLAAGAPGSFEAESWPQPDAMDAAAAGAGSSSDSSFSQAATELFLRHQEEAFAVLTATGGIDPCTGNGANPCLNGGTCFTVAQSNPATNATGIFTCYCTPAFSGTNCSIPVEGRELLLLDAPNKGLYTPVADADSVPLTGIVVVQGGINAGPILRLNITSQVRGGLVRGLNSTSAGAVMATFPFGRTVSIPCLPSTCGTILASLVYEPAEHEESIVAYNVAFISAEDFAAGTGGNAFGARKHVATLQVRAEFQRPEGATGIYFQGISLLGPATLSTIQGQAISLNPYVVSDPDILNNFKVNAVRITITAFNGTILTPTLIAFQRFIDDSGRLQDVNAYLSQSFYKGGNTPFDTLVITLDDQFNSTVVSIRITNTLLNVAPVIAYTGATPTGSDTDILNAAGFAIKDDACDTCTLTLTVSSLIGFVSVNASAGAADFLTTYTTVDTLANLNAQLAQLRYTQAGVVAGIGNDVITVIVNDGGNTGFGGVKEGVGSVPVLISVAIRAPQQMASPIVTDITALSATLKFSPVPSSSPVYSDQATYEYLVQYAERPEAGNEASWNTVFDGVAATELARTVSIPASGNLTPNTVYLVRVQARNSVGTGEWSEPIATRSTFQACPSVAPCGAFRTPFALPRTVVSTISDITATSMVVSWTAAAPSATSSPATEYLVTYTTTLVPGTGACLAGLTLVACRGSITVIAPTLTYTLTGLAPRTTYTVTVSAVNEAGNSAATASTPSSVVTLPLAPVITSFTIAHGGGLNSNLYHANNIFTITFDQTTNLGTNRTLPLSALRFTNSLDGATAPVVNVGTISCRTSLTSSAVIQCLVLSVVGADPFDLGTLTVTPTGAPNIYAQGYSSLPAPPSRATSPELAGSFGRLDANPGVLVRDLAQQPAAFKFQPYRLSGLFIATAPVTGLATVTYTAVLSVQDGTGTIFVGASATFASVGMAQATFDGTVAQINAWLPTAYFIPGAMFFGQAAVRLQLFPQGVTSGVALGGATAAFIVRPVNTAPTISVSGAEYVAPVSPDLASFTIAGETDSPFPFLLTFNDADLADFPLRPVSIMVSVTAPATVVLSEAPSSSVQISSPALVPESSFTFIGLLADVSTAVRLARFHSSEPFQVTYTINDLDNGGDTFQIPKSASVSFQVNINCVTLPATTFIGATFTPDYSHIDVDVAGFINYIGNTAVLDSPTSSKFDCAKLFTAATIKALGGDGVECQYNTGFQIGVATTSDATIVPGDELTTIENPPALGRCFSSPITGPAESVTLAPAPVVPGQVAAFVPDVVANGPTAVATCDGAPYSWFAQVNLGSGGRKVSYLWSCKRTDGSACPAFPAGTPINQKQFYLTSSFFPLGGSFVLTVQVTNFLGGVSSDSITVSRPRVLLPDVSGPATLDVQADDSFYVEFDASMPGCADQNQTLTFRWSVSPGMRKPMDSITSSTSALLILEDSLLPAQDYTFTLETSIKGRASSTSVNTVVVTVEDVALSASLLGGNYVTLSAGKAFALDATPSTLPLKLTPGTTTYTTTCVDAAGNTCLKRSGQPLIGSTNGDGEQIGARYLVRANMFNPQVLTFTTTVGVTTLAGVRQTSSFTQVVSLVAGTPLVASLEFTSELVPNRPVASINVQDTVTITTKQRYPDEGFTFAWDIVENGNFLASQPLESSLTRSSLTLNPQQVNYFTGGLTYTVQLSIYNNSDPSTLSIARIDFYVNQLPGGGSFNVDREQGISGLDEFLLSADGFTDREGDYPLIYQFYFEDRDGMQHILTTEQTDNFVLTLLPRGKVGFRDINDPTSTFFTLTVGVKVMDGDRGFQNFERTLEVKELPNELTAEDILRIFRAEIQGVSPILQVQDALVFAAILNADTNKGVDQSVVRSAFLDTIVTNVPSVPASLAITALTNILGDNNIRSKSVILKMLRTIRVVQARIEADPSFEDDQTLENQLFELYGNVLASLEVEEESEDAGPAGRRLLATVQGLATETAICTTEDCRASSQIQDELMSSIDFTLLEQKLNSGYLFDNKEDQRITFGVWRNTLAGAFEAYVPLCDTSASQKCTGTTRYASGGVRTGTNYLSGFGSNVRSVDFRMLLQRTSLSTSATASQNPYSSLQDTQPGIRVVSPVMLFDLSTPTPQEDGNFLLLRNLDFSANQISVILPVTPASSRCAVGATDCKLFCKTWSPVNAFTSANVTTLSQNGTHVFCRPQSVPLLIAIQAGGAGDFTPATPVEAVASTGGAAPAAGSSGAAGGAATGATGAAAGGATGAAGSATSASGAARSASSTGASPSPAAGSSAAAGTTTAAGSATTTTAGAGAGATGAGATGAATAAGAATARTGGATTTAGANPNPGTATGATPAAGGNPTAAATAGSNPATPTSATRAATSTPSTPTAGATAGATGSTPTPTPTAAATSTPVVPGTGAAVPTAGTTAGAQPGTSTGAGPVVPPPGTVTVYGPATLSFQLNVPANTDVVTLLRADIIAATDFPQASAPAARRLLYGNQAVTVTTPNGVAVSGPTAVTATFTPNDKTDPAAEAAAALLKRQLDCTGTLVQRKACAQAIRGPGKTTIFDGQIASLPSSSTTDGTFGSAPAVLQPGARQEPVGGADPNAGASSGSSGLSSGALAGIIIGCVVGGILLLLLVLFLCCRKKKQPEAVLVNDREQPASYGARDDDQHALAASERAQAERERERLAGDRERERASAAAAERAAQHEVAVDEPAAGQMDYKSVFALKNNVLTKDDGAGAGAGAAPAVDDNDVHFVLHQ